jgi:hypothetical protein
MASPKPEKSTQVSMKKGDQHVKPMPQTADRDSGQGDFYARVQ